MSDPTHSSFKHPVDPTGELAKDRAPQPAPKRESPLDVIAESFEMLGKPEHRGHAFYITAKQLLECRLDITQVPHPKFNHRIYFESKRNLYIVVRADAEGKFNNIQESWKRIR